MLSGIKSTTCRYIQYLSRIAAPKQVRTCNCSIAIYRVYDWAFSEDEINKNVRGSFVVDPAGKLSTTWGKLKRGF